VCVRAGETETEREREERERERDGVFFDVFSSCYKNTKFIRLGPYYYGLILCVSVCKQIKLVIKIIGVLA
jgi:hypothetical protein